MVLCKELSPKTGHFVREQGGNIRLNPFPKTVSDYAPPMIRPPSVCPRRVIFLRGNRHRPDESHFLRPPKLVLEGALCSTIPPPPKIAHYVPTPPLCDFPNKKDKNRSALWAPGSGLWARLSHKRRDTRLSCKV